MSHKFNDCIPKDHDYPAYLKALFNDFRLNSNIKFTFQLKSKVYFITIVRRCVTTVTHYL